MPLRELLQYLQSHESDYRSAHTQRIPAWRAMADALSENLGLQVLTFIANP
jgi:hypothetical protein